jgi:Ca2+-transporting ATPase
MPGSDDDKSKLMDSLLRQGISKEEIDKVYRTLREKGYGEEEARALSFTTLIVANLGLIFANRSWSQTILSRLGSRNWALWGVTGGAAVFLGCALYIPALRGVFKFSVLSVWDVLMCVAFGAASTVWFELLKVFKWTRGRG